MVCERLLQNLAQQLRAREVSGRSTVCATKQAGGWASIRVRVSCVVWQLPGYKNTRSLEHLSPANIFHFSLLILLLQFSLYSKLYYTMIFGLSNVSAFKTSNNYVKVQQFYPLCNWYTGKNLICGQSTNAAAKGKNLKCEIGWVQKAACHQTPSLLPEGGENDSRLTKWVYANPKTGKVQEWPGDFKDDLASDTVSPSSK